MPNYDGIMILSLAETSFQATSYQGSGITMHQNTIISFKSHSIVMNFVDFIKLDYL